MVVAVVRIRSEAETDVVFLLRVQHPLLRIGHIEWKVLKCPKYDFEVISFAVTLPSFLLAILTVSLS